MQLRHLQNRSRRAADRLVNAVGAPAGGFYTRETRGSDGRRGRSEIVTLAGEGATSACEGNRATERSSSCTSAPVRLHHEAVCSHQSLNGPDIHLQSIPGGELSQTVGAIKAVLRNECRHCGEVVLEARG